MVSPGVTIDLAESLGRLEGRDVGKSPSESAEEEAGEEALSWKGVGGIVAAM